MKSVEAASGQLGEGCRSRPTEANTITGNPGPSSVSTSRRHVTSTRSSRHGQHVRRSRLCPRASRRPPPTSTSRKTAAPTDLHQHEPHRRKDSRPRPVALPKVHVRSAKGASIAHCRVPDTPRNHGDCAPPGPLRALSLHKLSASRVRDRPLGGLRPRRRGQGGAVFQPQGMVRLRSRGQRYNDGRAGRDRVRVGRGRAEVVKRGRRRYWKRPTHFRKTHGRDGKEHTGLVGDVAAGRKVQGRSRGRNRLGHHQSIAAGKDPGQRLGNTMVRWGHGPSPWSFQVEQIDQSHFSWSKHAFGVAFAP
ncbi:hypothetical protein C8034_v011469 [Colletotrichum sidae]|uniref:Uncharacterized protein n=1 Tax=Colletotrichum sidae TaxID=1347389 RepID=A0A4R8TJ82_9PEZI|nr:hypothetical protein C8034_v011469 [Colletotrichum sidae]